MYFLIDEKNLIIFGWSPKCGCTHIKAIFYYLQNDIVSKKDFHLHSNFKKTEKKLSMDILNSIGNYTTIIFCRNPYKRIVSGFLDKYKLNGQYRNKWPDKNIRFNDFVNELGNWKVVDRHHFLPQTSEFFTDEIMNSKVIKCIDIENIDYKYLEKLINKKIPEQLIKFKGKHTRDRIKPNVEINKHVYNLNIDEYHKKKGDIKYFYNEKIKEKVLNFYENDFLFFRKFGLDYKLEL